MPLKTSAKRVFFAALCAIVIALPATALELDENDPIGELVNQGISNNPELKALRQEYEARLAGAKAAGYLDDPVFKIELEDLSRDRPFNISPGNAMLTRYTISQMLPFPGKLSLKERIAFKEALGAQAKLSSRELELAAQIKEACYEYAYLQEAIRVTNEIKELATQMAKTAESRYSTGLAGQQDIIRTQAEATALTKEIIELEAEKEAAEARLKELLNVEQKEAVAMPRSLPKGKASLGIDELTGLALLNPEVRMLEFEKEASGLSTELAKKNYYPDFMVGFAPVQMDGEFESFDLMFQMNIPLWRGKYKNLEKEAVANENSIASRLMSKKNAIKAQVRRMAAMASASEESVTIHSTSLIPQTELSFESALKNYQSGTADYINLLEAERELKSARLSLLKAALEYNKRIAGLEMMTGKDLR